ncbi:MAG: UDP-2,4-diacetamido-2,4,6-trideoxy-beta-L-altropyranose hydrolase [Pseudanabaena sp.]|jgi:UDP-2,4-diacetamido-2,4,6-trideoxy-beta-L-altropyranose hydrolase|nr:UDP-2,4-diacetamido-2,4,6-trideoxy-beta-L-altropyranose hydrolase [Pseudanabaena sp. M007S1SP1A06QC]MCA6614567.1 UDP-2,4-diacetamido-2,4,6-trideoxy-beta-L-altropyranose hydrolase [Pseudanabaena sp. M090S1SP1A06QC]MCE2977354.1 UDP-2,4-diacetamido-2,4,6-trideoxy-beta-L-altropyranose hydrolase [Pseudanabaena sp. CoA8_M7]
MKRLIIRADASTQTGSGHVMRCLALAQAWNDQGGETILVLAEQILALESKLIAEGITLVYLETTIGSDEDAQQTASIANKYAASWVVVDGYQFGAKYQKELKGFGLKILFLDDNGHAEHYFSDLVLNQNISADINIYSSREPYTQLLLGTEYTLLRRDFLKWREWKRLVIPNAYKILVTLGGSDPENVTLKVIQSLSLIQNNNLDIVVVIGGTNPNYEQLTSFTKNSLLSISLQINVGNMDELMAWADIAIAAGGSTNWELAFMGLPSIVITIADNQKAIAAELDRQGAIINLGWHQDVTIEQIGLVLRELIGDRPKRETMSKKGRELVDGNGAKRVISKINSMSA